jgi:hypothetical protein
MQTSEQLVEKWEESGLLEGAVNKSGLSYALEHAASHLLEYSAGKYDDSEVQFAASVTFPVIRRVLGEKEFLFVPMYKDINYTREVEFVEYAGEEAEAQVCQAVAEKMKERVSKYPNLKIHGVSAECQKGGFNLHFLCS